jgi:type II restriction/modification system DNA methylase subunit YeeA
METAKLKKFAQFARRSLLEQVSAKLKLVLAEDSAARRENPMAVAEIEKQIFGVAGKYTDHSPLATDHSHRRAQLVDRVAYIWFNRFCALRFMDVNRYTRIGVVSPAEGQFQPEILAEAKMGHIDEDMVHDKVRQQIFALLDGKAPSRDPQGEAYRLLVVAACNFWNKAMPFLFQRIDDYTELLMPDDLLSGNSILAYTREAMTPELCGAEPVGSGKWIVDSNSDSSHSPLSTLHSNAGGVEVIGWLYQFYISEKKDEVFDGLKKNKKITPENIPAATQLFTPHWIVRYLVENSLGRLWLLNRPNSRLKERMEYYIEPQEDLTAKNANDAKEDKENKFRDVSAFRGSNDFLVVQTPEEIKICDPACGSGHMLTYAFDLLYAIYEEEGVDPAEIPEKILTHNLYGIEIDERAGELAAFALTMKARAKQRRFFNKGIKPNICVLENVHFDEGELGEMISDQWSVASSASREDILHDLNLFEEADNFGSLVRPRLTAEQCTKLRDFLTGHWSLVTGHSLFDSMTHQKVLQALRQADYLSQKYHVVIANPPYMGARNMSGRLGAWLKDNYEVVKSDLFSAFILRCSEIGISKAFIGVMCPNVWMYISTHEYIRTLLINSKRLLNLVELPLSGFKGATVQICAFNFANSLSTDTSASFIKLTGLKGGDDEMASYTRDAISNSACKWFYETKTSSFNVIPGTPIAYWVSPKVLAAFNVQTVFESYATPRQGLGTTNNDLFVRFWSEVNIQRISFDCANREEAMLSRGKWFPYTKGGGYRKWFGNDLDVVDWHNDGQNIREALVGKNPNIPRSETHYFKEGITWGLITSASFSARYSKQGGIFDVGGSKAFPPKDSKEYFLGLLNSHLSSLFLKTLNPTLNFQVGDLKRIPVIRLDSLKSTIRPIVKNLVDLSKYDWDSYETSWDFTSLPLVKPDYRQPTLKATYQKLRAHWREMTLDMQRLEEENNRIFIEAYGLQDELTPEVPLTEITLTCNPHYRYGVEECEVGSEKWEDMEARLLQDTVKELVSYAVGCMFGRYALDKPGLILANQGETLADFVRKVCSEEWVVDSEGENDGNGSQLSGVDRLAEGDGFGGVGLSGDQAVSEGRALRADQSGQAVGGFHSVQHSGRPGQKIDGGVSEFLVDCERFKSRDGDPNPACPALELCNDRYSATNSQSVRGSEPPAERADEQPEVTTHCPLSTIHFLPDDDNVIPMLDGDWFTDDIAERFKQFLKVAFGAEHYEENLRFVEDALGKDIRKYFLKDFYSDHVKRYKKRPIYWLFSSPKGSFNALIYMHRYRPDTVSVVLNDYLREFRTKLTSHKNHLEAVSISGSASQGEKTKALKEIEKITKMIAEMEEYEREVLYPLATEQVEIDLDDGVKVNYPKLGSALKKIPGLDAKED